MEEQLGHFTQEEEFKQEFGHNNSYVDSEEEQESGMLPDDINVNDASAVSHTKSRNDLEFISTEEHAIGN